MMPLLGLRARKLPPEGFRTMREDQPAPSEAVWAVRPWQTVSRPLDAIPEICCVALEVLVRAREMGRPTKSTYEMLTKSWAALKVNSQKSQDSFVFGSDGLVTDGSTRAGPGLRKKVNVPSTENQIRLPAR